MPVFFDGDGDELGDGDGVESVLAGLAWGPSAVGGGGVGDRAGVDVVLVDV